jgi:hypothetical protein
MDYCLLHLSYFPLFGKTEEHHPVLAFGNVSRITDVDFLVFCLGKWAGVRPFRALSKSSNLQANDRGCFPLVSESTRINSLWAPITVPFIPRWKRESLRKQNLASSLQGGLYSGW